jgi:hypothetical protein
MTHNEGIFDRVTRVVLGLVLLSLVVVGPHTWPTWVGWFGLIPLATGVFGYCPLYRVIRVRTCPVNH